MKAAAPARVELCDVVGPSQAMVVVPPWRRRAFRIALLPSTSHLTFTLTYLYVYLFLCPTSVNARLR